MRTVVKEFEEAASLGRNVPAEALVSAMNLQEAGDAARVNHQGSSSPIGTTMTDGGVVHLENGFGAELRNELERRGHTLGPSDGSFGGYQAIMFDSEQGVYYGASEVRKDGQAAGY
jgi:gamma-glutamyltranspeptidase/glutathione hydrolase